ncbi:MAG: DUF541 domain-containing protein [Alphaproteobacteria bacterium]|nr:DUF541 domain-containing protein [Alphaproteobacteria bacterium]
MTPSIRTIATALIAAVLVVLAAPAAPQALEPAPRGITVIGAGSVTVAPDMAEITLGVVAEAPAAAAALAAASEAMAKLFQRLNALGVAPRDIETQGLSVVPRYEPSPRGRGAVAAYEASNTIQIRLRALDQAGPIIDQLVADGANRVHGIRFTIADPAAALDEARRRAMADARRKAELFAAGGGVKIGRVLAITETGAASPRPVFAQARAAEAVPIAAGEQALHASVTVVYALE